MSRSIDDIRRRAREIVQAARRYHFHEAVGIAEASLRLTDHEGFMRGERIARQALLVAEIDAPPRRSGEAMNGGAQ
jgi:hypothetical protein